MGPVFLFIATLNAKFLVPFMRQKTIYTILLLVCVVGFWLFENFYTPASYSPPLKEPVEPPAEFRRQTVGISDPDLKSALENLAANVTSRTRDSK